MALVFALGGIVSATWRARGGGFAVASFLSLLILWLDASDLEEVGIAPGFWVAFGFASSAVLVRLGARIRARRRRSRSALTPEPRPGRLRRLASTALFAIPAIAVVAVVDTLTR